MNSITLSNLEATPGSRRRRLRLGMGEGSGTGQTATRGQKGQRSRSGDGKLVGFEGGQNPLWRRIPKRGFSNGRFRDRFQAVSLESLARVFASQLEVGPEAMRMHRLARGPLPIKVLGDGELKSAMTVKAHAFSTSAKEKIQKAGGTAEVLPR